MRTSENLFILLDFPCNLTNRGFEEFVLVTCEHAFITKNMWMSILTVKLDVVGWYVNSLFHITNPLPLSCFPPIRTLQVKVEVSSYDGE